MKRLFLHIGFAKTGSSSIQKNLLKNASLLLENGYYYPCDSEAPYFHHIQHDPLSAAIPKNKSDRPQSKSPGSPDQVYEALFSEIEGADFDTLILSAEGFGSINITSEQLELLKGRFSQYKIKIIVYIRPQDSHFLSYYQQKVKAGASAPFDFAMHESMAALRFGTRLSPWRAVFGPENVIVRPFVPKLWHEGDLFYDFLSALSIPNDGIKLAKPANVSLDYRAVELLRSLNALHKRGLGKRQRFMNRVLDFDKAMGENMHKTKMILSSEQSSLLRDYYRSENEAALAGTGVNVDEFFPAPPEGRNACLPPETLPQEFLLRVISGLALEKKRSHNKVVAK